MDALVSLGVPLEHAALTASKCSFLETAQQLCSMQMLRDTDEVAVLLRVVGKDFYGQALAKR